MKFKELRHLKSEYLNFFKKEMGLRELLNEFRLRAQSGMILEWNASIILNFSQTFTYGAKYIYNYLQYCV